MPGKRRYILFALVAVCGGALPAATLQEQLELAVAAFREGDYAAAHWRFEALEVDYGAAPEFGDRGFQRLTLPLRAYAALLTDRPTEALAHYHAVLSEHSPDRGLRAFCLYHAALAQARCGAPALAAGTLALFRESFPETPEAGLALLREADLRHGLGESAEAGALLDAFYESEAPTALRLRGRLRALQIAVETKQPVRSRRLLFETPWRAEEMPDIAVLSFAALEVGDLLLSEDRPDDAVRAYRHVLPREVLLAKQAERLAREEARLAEAPSWAGGIWRSHAVQQVKRLRGQLEQLRTMADYTPRLYLRFGQAYLLAGRHREAVLLFRTVAEDENFEQEVRAQAHYRWVVAQCQAEAWAEARGTAAGFLEKHPGHALVAEANFLVAHAYQGEGRFAEAVEVLDRLIEAHPEAPGAPRWYFIRGYNHCVLEAYGSARESFAAVPERFPQSPQVLRCRLWHGLTRFFERDYESGLIELAAVRADAAGRPEEPEAVYRIANLHYAGRDYEAALRETAVLLADFPGHHRAAAAQALRGDALMGLGELTKAAAAFREVPPEDARLFDYATFQTAKIYRALERPDLLEAHLRAYIAREDAARRPRVSEALFWLGRSMREDGRIGEAFPVFEEALNRFGDDPQARAVPLILEAWAELWARREREGPAPQSFEQWTAGQLETALQEDRLTWFARLTLFSAGRQRARLGNATADATLLSIHRLVPPPRQDAACLAAVGVLLAERGYRSADDYFEALLTRFPDQPERAAAYYGKARLAAETADLESARRWLVRFLEETPTDPLAAEARLLAADILLRQGRLDEALVALEEILTIEELRGRPHARALAATARVEEAAGEPGRAIACWQRVYTLYRAYPELLAEAYWESARLFEALGDPRAARNTLAEMLADRRLTAHPQHALAQARLPELEAMLPAAPEIAAQSAEPPPQP